MDDATETADAIDAPTILPSSLLPEDSTAASGDKVKVTITGTMGDDGITVESVDSVDSADPEEETNESADDQAAEGEEPTPTPTLGKRLSRGKVKSPAEALYGSGN